MRHRGAAFRRSADRHRRDVGHPLRIAVAERAGHRRRHAVRARLRRNCRPLHLRSLVPEGASRMSTRIALFLGLAVLSGLASTPARAHITPPVVLASDREAVARLLPAATRYFVREVRLFFFKDAATTEIYTLSLHDDYYRFYVGRT